jgi:glycosyltransferase involved in cell wall biosynthesis
MTEQVRSIEASRAPDRDRQQSAHDDRIVVLIVQYLSEISGSWVVLRTLLERLDQKRFRIILVVPDAGPVGHQVPPGVEVVELPIPRLRASKRPGEIWRIGRDSASTLVGLRRLIRSRRVDVVHVNTLPNLIPAIAAAVSGVPSVWHVHELEIKPVFVFKALLAAARHLPHRVVAVSDAVAALFPDDSRVLRIYNGIDTEHRFGVLRAEEESAARFALRLGSDAFVVTMLARIAPIKGVEEFVALGQEVVRRLRVAPEKLRFVLSGDPSSGHEAYARRVLDQMAGAGYGPYFMHLSGDVNVREVIAASDVVVQCSTIAESFGLTLVEAMALRRPVIAADSGATPEIVRHGVDGFVAPSRAIPERAVLIEILFGDPSLRPRMGDAGRERVCELFSADRFAVRFSELYRDVSRHSGKGSVPRRMNE